MYRTRCAALLLLLLPAVARADAKADADYTESLGLDAKNANAYEGRGAAHFGKRDDDKALEDYTRAVELKPSARLLVARAGVHGHKKDHEKALLDYLKAQELDPK